MNRLPLDSIYLDTTDRQLIALLFENARLKTAELARRIGLSAPSTAERIRRLEDAGIIRGYTITIDAERLGLPLQIYIRVRPVPGQMQNVADILDDTPEVVSCQRITGEDCFVAQAHVTSVQHMEALIDRLTPVSMTNTSIVQSSPVDRRLPAIPADQTR